MKSYISRRDAILKYGVSIEKLLRRGLLQRISAESVGYTRTRPGPPVRWVYDEEELEALPRISPATEFVPRNKESTVFDLFVQGLTVVDVVRQTKLPLKEVLNLRDVYLRETNQAAVFELFAQGMNMVDVVRQTKLPLEAVKCLREIYQREVGGLLLPGWVIEELGKLGCPIRTPQEVIGAFKRLLVRVRELAQQLQTSASLGEPPEPKKT